MNIGQRPIREVLYIIKGMKTKEVLCWLLKTEPSDCSIDDIAKSRNGISWDGVRNYQARNFLRDSLKAGDSIIIYHSSIKEPAAVGTGIVVGEPYPDPTQFDKKSVYYDPKAKNINPPWISRRIKFQQKFKKPVSIFQMRQNPRLFDLLLLKKGSRLSIQPVSLHNYKEIVKMANG